MIKITSVKNQRVEFVKKLKDKRFRKEQGLLTVEGENLVKDLPSEIEVESVFVLEERLTDFEYILARYGEDKIIAVDCKVMKAVSETVTPSGILAVVRYAQGERNISGDAVILDGISDPGNFGTIVRTCAAVGVRNVVAIDCVDPTMGKVVRASMGGIFKVNILECDRAEALDLLKERELYALDMSGESIYSLQRPSRPFALAVGSESKGLSEEIKNKARVISLPMSGQIESLNAAVSLSVALYEFAFGK